MNMNCTKKRRPGRPSNHGKIKCHENGKIYDTFVDAAKDIGGFACKVYLVAHGGQSHHHGYHFDFVKE